MAAVHVMYPNSIDTILTMYTPYIGTMVMVYTSTDGSMANKVMVVAASDFIAMTFLYPV